MRASPRKMIGRTREIALLEERLGAVRSGESACVLLDGEAGIGKSLLADRACQIAADLSLRVFRGGADELDRSGPFGALTAALGTSAEGDPSAAATGAEFRALEQLVEVVESRALGSPVLIVVEDLQWADRETIVALRAIGRRLSHLPIALLASFRPWPRSPELETLIESWSREGELRLTLTALDADEVIALAADVIGATPGSTLALQLDSATGNPLFVGELVGALMDDGAIHVADGFAETGAAALPPSLRLTILRRVSMLGDGTVRLLQMASLLGTSFSLGDLAAISERSVAAVFEALEEALRAGVIEDAGELLRFRHDLVREALYSDLPTSARRALHRQAGRLLATVGAPALQVAEQLSLGVASDDGEASAWLARAARESALRAPRRAVQLFERALELAPPDDAARGEMTLEFGEALVWAGYPARALSLAEQMLARSLDAELRDRARATIVRALWLDSRWQELVNRVEHWLAAGHLAESRRGLLLADLGMACFFRGDHVRGREAAAEALAIGEALADESVIFGALYALSPLNNARGDYAAELEASTRALAIAERGANPDLARFHPHFAQAMSLNSNDRYAEADEMFRLGLRLREELGTIWDLPVYQAGLADLHCQMGNWDDALAHAETGVAVADEVGTRLGVAVCASIAALIHAHRDNLAEAQRFLNAAEEQIARHGPQWGTAYWTCLARAQISEARGDAGAALAEVAGTWDQQADAPGLRAYLGPEVVRLALMNEPRIAVRVAAELEVLASDLTVASARGSVLLATGRVAGNRRKLEEAVAAFAQSGWVLQHAAALESLGTLLSAGADDAVTHARGAFESALELYESLGAQRDTARVLAAMRAAGMRRGSRAAHRQALKGWDSLTASESEVVRLCIDGLTNREIGERLFISRRTVQTHLSHAFTKLEVSSRVGLAAAAARRGESTAAAS
jgi:DNA-binding CsgD family transcriptional regulator